MDHLLSLSQAARMVGVTRKNLQQHIRCGDITVFEGSIRMSELHKVFPSASQDQSGMLEKMRLIKDSAVHKYTLDCMPDKEDLANEVQRLKLQLAIAQSQIKDYQVISV